MNSILSSFFAKLSFVAKSDITGVSLWTNLKIVNVEIDAGSLITEQPLGIDQYSQDQVLISLYEADLEASKIARPSVIKVQGIAPDISTLEALVTAYENVPQTITITTKGVIAEKMTITELTIVQEPEMLSASRVEFVLERANSPASANGGYNPAQQADTGTLGVSIQSPSSVSQSITTLYNDIATSVRGILS